MASFLEGHPKVERVWYPGLESHPDHQIASAQLSGYGGVVSFEIRGDLEETSRFIDAVEIPIIAPSLGGVETLIEQPALMSYFELSEEERLAVGIKGNLVVGSIHGAGVHGGQGSWEAERAEQAANLRFVQPGEPMENPC